MLLSLLAAYVPQDVVALSQKAEKLLKDPGGYQMDYTITDTRVGGIGKGVVAMAYPNSLRLRCDWSGADYEYIGNPKRGLEMEHRSRQYYEWDNQGAYGPPSGYVTGMSEHAFPRPVVTADFKRVALSQKDPTSLGIKAIGSEVAHGARYEGQTRLDVWMTAAGRVVKTSQRFTDPSGSVTTIVCEFKPTTKPKLGFDVHPMTGYTSVGLPRENTPIVGIERPFPKIEGLSFGRTTLVIAAGDDPLSAEVLNEAKTVKDIDVKVLSLSKLDSNIPHITIDPVQKLDLMGTPVVWLVRKSGEVFWGAAGHDSAKQGSFAKRVRAAIAEDAED